MANEMYNAIPATASDPAYGLAAKQFSINYLEALYAKHGAWKHVRNFTADVANYGETVTIPSFPRLTAVDVTPSTGSVSYNNTQITAQTVTMNKIKAVAYAVPEHVLIQSKVDVRTAFAKEAAKAVEDTIDHELVKLIASLSTNAAGALGSDLDESKCLAAMGKIVENYGKLTDPDMLCWVLPASQFGPVHALKGYANSYRLVAPSTVSDGSADIKADVDTLYGIPLFFRNDSEMTVTGGKIGGLFYVDSVGVAIQRQPSLRQPMPIPGTINTELMTYAIFGINLIKEPLAVKLRCK